jgi:hypothetical protein
VEFVKKNAHFFETALMGLSGQDGRGVTDSIEINTTIP